MAGRSLLIVESPSKAKTLKKYLGRNFEVLASYGHVRDLEAKEGAVDPAHGFRMRYALVEKNKKHVDAIARAAEDAEQVLLATDPDREGEAIAWHLSEILKGKKSLRNRPLKRVVFYEITEQAVKDGVAHPRNISMQLVNAQQARRALDHLVGFNLSPLLWKKIGPSLSAGRVQSPALRLIVEREQEIENFKTREYWTVHLESHKGKDQFSARLTQYNGERVEQFTITTAQQQQAVVDDLLKSARNGAEVVKVERKPKLRYPSPPFITSTLQQEAVRKLGMTAQRAMRTAQELYEGVDIGGATVGLITYMRTDSTNLANEALQEIRGYIAKHFSPDYLPKGAVHYRSKSKNAQEAHEGIRPTSIARSPDRIRSHLSADQARLYEMIWKRTLACQMTPARFDTTSVDLNVGRKDTLFRANGQTLVFPGFIAVYKEDVDDSTEEGDERLPPLAEGERVPVDRLFGEQHFTQPPPRYTEASLVKTLEEYGIGRPSTYASIISTLQDRGYALLDKKRFVPTDLGRMVNGFLTQHFDPYIDYEFTARMEDQLDFISNGEREWVPVLNEFWKAFSGTLDGKQGVARGIPLPDASPRVSSWNDFSVRVLDKQWKDTGTPLEHCEKCGKVVLLQNSKRGLFVGCSGYPKCDYTRPWGGLADGPLNLGRDPKSGMDVLLMRGPYGFYVQLGPTDPDSKTKPKRAAWPKNMPVAGAELEPALKLLSLPRQLGNHPHSGSPVEANIGPYGPYVKHDGTYKSIPKADSVYDITLERAVELLAAPKTARGPAGKALGVHPEDRQPVSLLSGRYGPYVKHGRINATVPQDYDPADLTLAQAVEILAAKAARGPVPPKRKRGSKGGKAAAPESKTARKPAPSAGDGEKPTKAAKPKKRTSVKAKAGSGSKPRPRPAAPPARTPAARKR
jgi:DNA topoisomerase I